MDVEQPTASTSASAENEAEEDGEQPKKGKISTSGPRMSRREAYRSSKGFTVKQAPKTVFRAKGEGQSFLCPP